MHDLELKIDPKFKKRYDLHIRLGKFLVENPRLFQFVSRLHQLLATMVGDHSHFKADTDFQTASMSAEIVQEKAITEITNFRDLTSAISYAKQVYDPDFATERHRTESHALYGEQERQLRDLLENDKKIKGVLNFGVCYGYIDSILAKMFVDLPFIGIDLSKYTKAFNEAEFSDIGNLQFVAGDIFDLMEKMDCRDQVLFHSRILCQFPKNFLVKLYNSAYEKGFKYVAGYEQFGYSRETKASVVEFTEDFTKSVHWRDGMILHNYPGILKHCGFSIKNATIIKTNHSSPDYRVVCFIAEKK